VENKMMQVLMRVGRISGTWSVMLALAACSGGDGSGLDGGGDGGDGGGGGGGPVAQMIIDNTDFDWTLSSVDGGTKPHVGLRAGDPVIAYMLERFGDAGFVRVVEGSGGTLGAPQTLQTGYHYGPLDVAVSQSGTVGVAYHNHDWEDGAVALSDGDGWEISRISHAGHDGWDTSIAFAPDGTVHTLGIDPSQFGAAESLEHGVMEGGAWQVMSLGSGSEPYEWGTDLAIDSDGVLHAVYHTVSGRDLIYARNEGDDWTLTPIYEPGDAGRFATIAVDENDVVHVAFFQTNGLVLSAGQAEGSVLYGNNQGGEWQFQEVGTVDKHILGMEGARRTVALSVDGQVPHVAFIDTERLQLARVSGTDVQLTVVAEAGDDPFQVVSLAVDAQDRAHIVYSTITAPSPLDGQVWYLLGSPR
jgi:hypothetical protein